MYKYNVGEIINDINSGKLEILEQIKMGKNKIKGYKYRCLICGNIDIINEYNLINHRGCNVCAGKKILIGYSDIWTTNSDLAKLLVDQEDGYKYTEYSTKKVDWKCPICGSIIKNKIIHNINRQGLSCEKCSDKISYPEKFIYNLLDQLNIEFEYQLSKSTFKWCNNYRYDFYIPLINGILESNGLQHYSSKFNFNEKEWTLEKERDNDILKENIAVNNGIENYIIIDCRYSNMNYIKENILESKLNNLFDLSDIDWLKCHEYACNSLVKIACDLWSKKIRSTVKIGEIMKLSSTTICKYLKQGQDLDWCDYDAKQQMTNNGITSGLNSGKKIICLNNNKIFRSIKNAVKQTNISSIWNCCQGKTKYAGKDIKTGEYLYWMYYDEYIELHKNDKVINE